MARRIIIDTDPGQDDAIALLTALASPDELDVLAITAVAGNVPLALTELNSRKMVELANRTDVPVYAGAEAPLEKDLYTAEYVHGVTGIDGAGLSDPTIPLADGHAVDAIVELVMGSEPGTITLCPLGPLTNVGLALQKEPAIAERLQEIVLMGGGFFEGGNTTPTSEFNIFVDPKAADIVFRSGAPITVMSLDVTHRALMEPKHMERLAAIDTPAGRASFGMLDFYQRYDVDKYGLEGGPLHDPCVIAYLLRPSLFTGKQVAVVIETDSPLTEGMTVVDYWGMTEQPPNALWMRDIDNDGYFDLLIERIARIQ